MGWSILLSFLFLIVLVVLVLLLTSFTLLIDTEKEKYRLTFGQLVEARLVEQEGHPGILIRILWVHKFIDFFKMEGSSKAGKKPKRKKRKSRKYSPRFIFRLLAAILKSFHVKRLEINWDTGSGVRNGMMIPLQYLVTGPNVSFAVNWSGTRHVLLVLENKAGRVGWAVIRAFVFKR